MVVTIKKDSKKKQIKEALEKVEQFRKKAKGKGNIAHLFGSNPKEVDGLEFQKQVRIEWQ